jgi:hypothetical protein
MAQKMVRIAWCRDAGRAGVLAKLFSENLTDSYISHCELQGPRALAPEQWAPNIAQVLERDLLGRISNPDDPAAHEVSMLEHFPHDVDHLVYPACLK